MSKYVINLAPLGGIYIQATEPRTQIGLIGFFSLTPRIEIVRLIWLPNEAIIIQNTFWGLPSGPQNCILLSVGVIWEASQPDYSNPGSARKTKFARVELSIQMPGSKCPDFNLSGGCFGTQIIQN